ncbi:MAG: glycosyltransferase [Cyclobacteriaceae bacterium]|nr:glycosyltransferase [Cyclobacteriaceae bacterium]
MPQLTILMPAFNAALYIQEAIESLLTQSFSDFDLWIIDDASTDETLNIINSFQDPRIKILTNEVNQGKVRTINKLVKEIQSPYFTITDADDISHPQRLEKQLKALEQDQTLMMCGTSFWAISEKGFLIRKLILLRDIQALRKASLEQSQFLGASTVMRSEVIDLLPHLYREYFIANFADADLSSLILDKYPCTNLTEPLYFYRIIKSSITRNKVTVRNLNLHRLIGFLSAQRRTQGQDCLQQNLPEQANIFLSDIQAEYDQDPSFFFRHQAFFHLYWGLMDLAFENGRLAISKSPFRAKNWVSFLYIIFRIGLFYLNRSLNKVHYRQLIQLMKKHEGRS